VLLLQSDQSELRVMADGWVMEGKAPELVLGDEWRQRRLSAAGLEQLLATVDAAALPNCTADANGAVQELTVVRSGKPIFSARTGSPGHRTPNPAERLSLHHLMEQLADVDALIAPEHWIGPQWQPYPPNWMVSILFDPGRYRQCQNRGLGPCTSSGVEIELPGGTDLLTFGDPQEGGEVPARCGLISEAEAHELVERLHLDFDVDASNYMKDYWIDGAIYSLSLFAQLPHQPGCTARVPGPGPAVPDDAFVELNPCHFAPAEAREQLEITREIGSSGLKTSDWASCWLYAGHGDLWISMRSRPTTSAEADTYARSLFGTEGIVFDRLADRTIYRNVCSAGVASCHTAVAISVDPYFFVLGWSRPDGPPDDLEYLARALAP
jgi:hypothetical protein